MLRAVNLGKRFGGRWIFRGVEFEVTKGQRLIILGRNGSGKSTLLKTLSTLLPASEGHVELNDLDPRLCLGYAALDSALYPTLTAKEHLQLSGNLRGCQDKSDELLERVGIRYAAETLASVLSSGMKARLKLAMALQASPPILMLDEPGASLDEEGRQLVEDIAISQSQIGCLIMATNDPRERRLATHELELAF